MKLYKEFYFDIGWAGGIDTRLCSIIQKAEQQDYLNLCGRRQLVKIWKSFQEAASGTAPEYPTTQAKFVMSYNIQCHEAINILTDDKLVVLPYHVSYYKKINNVWQFNGDMTLGPEYKV